MTPIHKTVHLARLVRLSIAATLAFITLATPTLALAEAPMAKSRPRAGTA